MSIAEPERVFCLPVLECRESGRVLAVGRCRLDRALIEFNICSRQRVVEPAASGESCKARARERKRRTVTAKQTSGLCPYRKSINYDKHHQSSALSILSRFLNLSSVAALKTTLLYGKIKVTGDPYIHIPCQLHKSLFYVGKRQPGTQK